MGGEIVRQRRNLHNRGTLAMHEGSPVVHAGGSNRNRKKSIKPVRARWEGGDQTNKMIEMKGSE